MEPEPPEPELGSAGMIFDTNSRQRFEHRFDSCRNRYQRPLTANREGELGCQ